jgi:outer membrane lipoprotein-sorting protein
MRAIPVLLAFMTAILFPMLSWTQQPSATEIMQRVDGTMNAPKDQEVEAELVLIDDRGNEKTRVIQMFQKGSDRRLVRFTEPADQRGIAVLTLPEGFIYVYLPAFKQVKRIASHVRKNRFAGTDFSYEDLEARSFVDAFSATLLGEEGDHFVLKLVPHDSDSEYSSQKLWVRRDNFVPQTIEFYDRAGRLCKKLIGRDIEKIDGYWVVREQEMIDLLANHRTRMVLRQVRFDSGLSDNLFTERHLQR